MAASTLRWRARFAKEAMAFSWNNDDSTVVAFSGDPSSSPTEVPDHPNFSGTEETDNDWKKKESGGGLLQRMRWAWLGVLSWAPPLPLAVRYCGIPASATLVAVLAGIRALHRSKSILVPLAVTAVLVLCVILVAQQVAAATTTGHGTGLTRRSDLRKSVDVSRHRVQILHLQRERWHRHLAQLDGRIEVQRTVRHQLVERFGEEALRGEEEEEGGGSDVPSVVAVVRDYRHCCGELQRHLQLRVQEAILRAIVLGENGRNSDGFDRFQLTAVELERLVQDLGDLRGVSIRESMLREILTEPPSAAAGDDGFSSSSAVTSLPSVLRLLRQLTRDGELAQASWATTTPGRASRASFAATAATAAEVARKRKAVVFDFDVPRLVTDAAVPVARERATVADTG